MSFCRCNIFIVVFTIPNRIFPFCLYNQRVVYDLLFHSAAATLQEFGYDPGWLGGKTGFFMVLHTWGQLLPVHPHVHCVIPAVGYDEETDKCLYPKYEKNNFLYPVKALSKVFRGKFMSGLEKAFFEGKLTFPEKLSPLCNPGRFKSWLVGLVSHKWVVYAKKPFGSPESVLRYVGQYTHRVAISNSRILSCENGEVRFRFKNYKKKDEVTDYRELWEETQLPVEEFISRFLHHVLPLNYARIRYYGFLSGNNKALAETIRNKLIAEKKTEVSSTETEVYKGMHCPRCETGVLLSIVIFDGSGNILRESMDELLKFRGARKEKKHTERPFRDFQKATELLDTS